MPPFRKPTLSIAPPEDEPDFTVRGAAPPRACARQRAGSAPAPPGWARSSPHRAAQKTCVFNESGTVRILTKRDELSFKTDGLVKNGQEFYKVGAAAGRQGCAAARAPRPQPAAAAQPARPPIPPRADLR
jgi:hypothetical protein